MCEGLFRATIAQTHTETYFRGEDIFLAWQQVPESPLLFTGLRQQKLSSKGTQ